jgi:ABC-2 type transport system ATP-binding protein
MRRFALATAKSGAVVGKLGGVNDVLPSVQLHGVQKNFGQVRAVRGIDLTVHPGEVVAFLGPNGAGKTTTIDMMLGLSRPSSGTVEVYGMPPAEAVARGLVAAVMQTGGLLREITVAETVRMVATLFANSRPVDEVLRRAGIADIADRRVGKCSGGQQQRLRFALALLPDPELLILDEPTTGMDVEGRREFWSAIREDTERGRTVLFATHYLEEADAYADRIVLMSHGRIVADGTAAEVKALTAGRTVGATLAGASAPSLSFLPGADSVEVRGDTVLVHASDSDAVARYLLDQTPAHDLEITARNLEDAFLALTSATEEPDDASDGEGKTPSTATASVTNIFERSLR